MHYCKLWYSPLSLLSFSYTFCPLRKWFWYQHDPTFIKYLIHNRIILLHILTVLFHIILAGTHPIKDFYLLYTWCNHYCLYVVFSFRNMILFSRISFREKVVRLAYMCICVQTSSPWNKLMAYVFLLLILNLIIITSKCFMRLNNVEIRNFVFDISFQGE